MMRHYSKWGGGCYKTQLGCKFDSLGTLCESALEGKDSSVENRDNVISQKSYVDDDISFILPISILLTSSETYRAMLDFQCYCI